MTFVIVTITSMGHDIDRFVVTQEEAELLKQLAETAGLEAEVRSAGRYNAAVRLVKSIKGEET